MCFCYEVNGIIASEQETERAKVGAALLLNDMWHSALVDFVCVSSRIIWVTFRFSRVNLCVVVMDGPNEGHPEERKEFWNDLVRVLDRVGNGYGLCMRDKYN